MPLTETIQMNCKHNSINSCFYPIMGITIYICEKCKKTMIWRNETPREAKCQGTSEVADY